MQETFRAQEKEGERGAFTAIYFLLAEGQKSHWHKVDAVETWLWHSGSALHSLNSAQGMLIAHRGE
jgi:predicted cupin superfamily sugar epimerase